MCEILPFLWSSTQHRTMKCSNKLRICVDSDAIYNFLFYFIRVIWKCSKHFRSAVTSKGNKNKMTAPISDGWAVSSRFVTKIRQSLALSLHELWKTVNFAMRNKHVFHLDSHGWKGFIYFHFARFMMRNNSSESTWKMRYSRDCCDFNEFLLQSVRGFAQSEFTSIQTSTGGWHNHTFT